MTIYYTITTQEFWEVQKHTQALKVSGHTFIGGFRVPQQQKIIINTILQVSTYGA